MNIIQDDHGNLSSTRVAFLLLVLALIVYLFVTISTLNFFHLQAIGMLSALILALNGTKNWKDIYKKKDLK